MERSNMFIKCHKTFESFCTSFTVINLIETIVVDYHVFPQRTRVMTSVFADSAFEVFFLK